MTNPVTMLPGHFCWLDLAAADAGVAGEFYHQLLGWSLRTHAVNGGHFASFRLGEEEVATIYQLRTHHLAQGVPSHWTPYIAVTSVDLSVRQAAALGASVVVAPFAIPGRARIALLQDPVGAVLGLWQPLHCETRPG